MKNIRPNDNTAMALASSAILCCLCVVSVAYGQEAFIPLSNIAVFVFGDSLVDAGNNNYLSLGLAKAKALPNGIDFPIVNGHTPTGRFTNGLTIPDILVRKAGVPTLLPPYMAPTTHGSAILKGVNYASGGGGILNETGRIFVQRISLDVQITNFENTKRELQQILGVEESNGLISRSIFSMTIGANDFINNYVSPLKDTSDIFLSEQEFSKKLITKYRSQLERLHSLGARKYIVVNVPLVGCIPYQRSLQFGKNGSCNARANQAASVFNADLKLLLQELNTQLDGANFIYADAFAAQLQVTNNYKQYGFDYIDRPCCGALGSNSGIINCRQFINPCPDRSKYFFWDPYHPTQAGYEILANEFFDGKDYISPMNLRDLIALGEH